MTREERHKEKIKAINRKEKKDILKAIENSFVLSQTVCDPISYMYRQTELLKMISEYFIQELREMEEEDGERTY